MTPLPDQQQETRLVRVKAQPVSSSIEQEAPQRRRSFFRIAGVFLGLLRDYTAEDIGCLVEAEISKREAAAKKAHAESEAIMALAAERHAEAELKQSEAARNYAEVRQRTENTLRTSSEAEIDDTASLADELERVVSAISQIKRLGGSVLFDKRQLKLLIVRATKELPEAPVIRGLECLVDCTDEEEDDPIS